MQEIMRNSPEAVETLIVFRLELKDYRRTMQDIEGVLIRNPSPHYLLLKLRTVMLWMHGSIAEEVELQRYIRTTITLLKENSHLLSPQDQKELQGLIEEFSKYGSAAEREPCRLLQGLLEKAVSQFSEDSKVGKFYSSR
jgi:hypothetical protein